MSQGPVGAADESAPKPSRVGRPTRSTRPATIRKTIRFTVEEYEALEVLLKPGLTWSDSIRERFLQMAEVISKVQQVTHEPDASSPERG